jgi:hypothetical protein
VLRSGWGKELHETCTPKFRKHPKKIIFNIENIQRRISSDLLKSAEEVLTKTVQGESFAPEIDALTSFRVHSDRTLTHKEHNVKTSHLYRLDPFVDEYGILCVGGRTRRSQQTYREKHPAFLPKDHYLSYLVITHT